MISFFDNTGKLSWKLFLLFGFLPLLSMTQSKSSLLRLIDQTHYYLNQYEKLNPLGQDYHPIESFSLSKKETREFIAGANYDATLTPNKDSVETYYAIFYFQDKITEHLIKIIQHPQFTQVNIPKLLESNELFIAVSEDQKLYNFSFSEKTGGTYRSRISIMHYTEFEPKDSLAVQQFNSSFAGDGYSQIFTLHTSQGTKYVLTGYVRGCSYCFESFVELISFTELEVQHEFSYSVNNRNWNDGVTYLPETQTIEIDYHTDDLTPYCFCDPEFEWDWDDVDEHNIPFINCKCKFIFNGSQFELIEESWKKK